MTAGSAPRRASVLVIDDEEIMREILEALLTRAGYEVRLASSGDAGLDLARAMPFDAAIAGSYDCVVVATDHDAFDYRRIADLPLVVDTRNALKEFDRPSILRL